MGCQGFIALLLKLLNFILTFMGAAMILYSVWMLNQWHSHVHPPPHAPSPSNPLTEFVIGTDASPGLIQHGQLDVPVSNLETTMNANCVQFRKLGMDFPYHDLPAPWFIYTFLGTGIIVCLVTCFGQIAAETTNGCCLACYSVLVIFLILLEAAFVGDIFFNNHWEKDMPDDPTGDFEDIKEFIVQNVEICKWVGLGVVVIQTLSLLLAMILRAMVSPRKTDYDSDGDNFPPRVGSRYPLLNHQGAQGPSAVLAENRSNRADAWSTRMRQKYGLDTKEYTYDSTSTTASAPTATSSNDNNSQCTIM